MFGSLLFVLSALGAEPAETHSSATCMRPVAKLVAPKIEHAAGATRSTDCRQIALWLRQWEQTARHRPALSLARRDVLRHRVETRTNAHAATAIEQLTGRIEVTKLRETFAWTITDRDAGRVCLEATPRDETEQLFYGSIRVLLDESDGALNQLQVVNRSGETRFVWKNDFIPESSPIRLVSAIDGMESPIIGFIPESSPIRLFNTTDEMESAIIGDELPSPLAPIPTSEAPAEDHGCASVPETSPEFSTSNIDPHEQAAKLWAWLCGIETPDPTDLSTVTPELDAILSQWETASRGTKAVNMDFTRIVYNSVFDVEKRSEGQLAYRAPDSMIIVIRGDKPVRGEVSDKAGKSGRSYRIEADRSETLVWTENAFIWANDEDKSYEVAELSLNKRPQALMLFSWLLAPVQQGFPFLFDIHSERLRREWSLTLTKLTDGKAVIEAMPRTAMLRRRFSRCFVRLDTKKWRIDAVKYIDSTSNVEMLYFIQDGRTNPEGSTGWNWGPDFTNFKARGYKLIAVP